MKRKAIAYAAASAFVATFAIGVRPVTAADTLPSPAAFDATIATVYAAALDRCRTVVTPREIFVKLGQAFAYPDPTDSIQVAASKLPVPIESGDRSTDIAALQAFLAAASARAAASEREEAMADVVLAFEDAVDEATHACTSISGHSDDFARRLGLGYPATGLTFLDSDRLGQTVAGTIAAGSPAARAGIARDDRILTYNHDDATGVERISFEHAGLRHSVRLEPENVAYPTTAFRPLDATTGYLAITGFGANTANEMHDAFAIAKSAGITSLVVDLRYAERGAFAPTFAVASLLARGTIADIDARGITTMVPATGSEAWTGRLAVLVSGTMTASAALVASAVQRNATGKLVGSESLPDLALRDDLALPTGEMLEIAVATLHLPGNSHVLEPDVPAAATGDPPDPLRIDLAHDPQVAAARRVLSL